MTENLCNIHRMQTAQYKADIQALQKEVADLKAENSHLYACITEMRDDLTYLKRYMDLM